MFYFVNYNLVLLNLILLPLDVLTWISFFPLISRVLGATGATQTGF